MDLRRLLAPRSIAVVGASTRPGSYGNQAVANLVAAGFPGTVYGVHPTARAVLGVPCAPRLADLPEPPDAVVIATPAPTVPDLVAQAAALGCGGAVVFAAGFGETEAGAALQRQLRAIAVEHALPVCGPNGNGIVSVGARAPMWGDSVTLQHPGPVALISQSGNVAVNALGSRRGLRLHTVVSCGNQAVLDAADYLLAVAGLDGVRAVALYLEAEGDGAKLARALAACAERDIGLAVLKAGVSSRGAAAAAAHTGSLAGDARVLRSLVTEAGGAWVHNPHELLEVVKALAYGRDPGRTARHPVPSKSSDESAAGGTPRGAAIVTCSGGDAATGADEAQRLGVALPELSAETVQRLSAVLPPSATAANPLDYTALLFGEPQPTAALVAAIGTDASIGAVVVNYDQPEDLDEAAQASWEGALAGILAGAASIDVPVVVASTLPDLMPAAVAERLVDAGVVPAAGLTEGVMCARALLAPRAQPQRLADIAATAAARVEAGDWLAEHEAKALLRRAGLPVPAGDRVSDVDAAVTLATALDGPVAMKLSSPNLHHKSDVGGVLLGLSGPAEVRAGFAALRALPGHAATPVLVEAMAAPGLELVVSVRRHGVVPVLVVGLGGVWVELLDDALILALPVHPGQIVERLRALRAAPLLAGARGRPAVDLTAVGRLAADVAALAIAERLALVELNPVIARPDGVSIVDALIQCAAPHAS
jgi:acetyl-CoA synthetase